MLKLIQFGLNTCDLAASLRLYSEAFGFRNAGAQGFWGESIKVQGLPPDSRALLWWMVGAQPLFQLELFHHTRPAQRPLPKDWRPCDHGWVRFGLGIPDFDRAVTSIEANGLSLLAPAIVVDGSRRAALFDPYVGTVIEIREMPSSDGPSALYATSSVSDLDRARDFYGRVLGLGIAPIDQLHCLDDEALWNLPGAQREGFLVEAGDILLEILRYDKPFGRPRPTDRRASDQGFGNVAFGAREKHVVADALARLQANGIEPTCTFQTEELLATYIIDAERESELAVIPEGMDSVLGFTALHPFFG